MRTRPCTRCIQRLCRRGRLSRFIKFSSRARARATTIIPFAYASGAKAGRRKIAPNMAIVEDPEGHEAEAFDATGVSFASRRVLEIGCGDGRLTKRYAPQAASVIAIDPDRNAVAQLAAELPTVDVRPI